MKSHVFKILESHCKSKKEDFSVGKSNDCYFEYLILFLLYRFGLLFCFEFFYIKFFSVLKVIIPFLFRHNFKFKRRISYLPHKKSIYQNFLWWCYEDKFFTTYKWVSNTKNLFFIVNNPTSASVCKQQLALDNEILYIINVFF